MDWPASIGPRSAYPPIKARPGKIGRIEPGIARLGPTPAGLRIRAPANVTHVLARHGGGAAHPVAQCDPAWPPLVIARRSRTTVERSVIGRLSVRVTDSGPNREVGGVAHFVLDRPEAYNAIDPPLRDELLARARHGRVGRHPLPAAAQRGTGLLRRHGPEGRDRATRRRTGRFHADVVVPDYRAVPADALPLVSAVHGVCAGMGLTLALAADHCVAAESARFFAAFVKRSLVPDGAAAMILPRLIGTARARQAPPFGEEVGAAEALDWGMVGEVVPDDTLVEAAHRRAEALAALPIHVVMYTQSLLARSFDIGLDTVLFEERLAQGVVSTSDDFAEGVERPSSRTGLPGSGAPEPWICLAPPAAELPRPRPGLSGRQSP